MVRYMFSINYDGRFQTLYIIGEVSPVKLASKWCMPTINIGTVRAGGVLEGREKNSFPFRELTGELNIHILESTA